MIVTSDICVTLDSHLASDERLLNLFIHANRQNFSKESSIDSYDVVKDSALLEHLSFTFLVSAPVFSFRSFMKERVTSYYEKPGVNRVFEDKFYIPSTIIGDARDTITRSITDSYYKYTHLLDIGIPPKDARLVLPISTYSDMIVTVTLRQLLSLIEMSSRTEHEDVIEIVLKMKDIAARHMPLFFSKIDRATGCVPEQLDQDS